MLQVPLDRSRFTDFTFFQPVTLQTAGCHPAACRGPTVLRKRKEFGVWSFSTLIKCCAGLT